MCNADIFVIMFSIIFAFFDESFKAVFLKLFFPLGIGKFCIVDNNIVKEEDLGNK